MDRLKLDNAKFTNNNCHLYSTKMTTTQQVYMIRHSPYHGGDGLVLPQEQADLVSEDVAKRLQGRGVQAVYFANEMNTENRHFRTAIKVSENLRVPFDSRVYWGQIISGRSGNILDLPDTYAIVGSIGDIYAPAGVAIQGYIAHVEIEINNKTKKRVGQKFIDDMPKWTKEDLQKYYLINTK